MKQYKMIGLIMALILAFSGISSAVAESNLSSPFKAVYENVSESVVGIKITTNMQIRNGRVSTQNYFVGSGVVIGDDGYVVTNHHVVENAQGVIVVVGEDEYPATLVASDEDSDIAVLKVEDLEIPAAKLGDSDALAVGDWALVIGNPLGEQYVNTLTVGVISGLNRDVGKTTGTTSMIQTDAAINSGNSGGGLFNIDGELVGITSSKLSNNGYAGYAAIESIGFAIPINTIKSISSDLIAYGEVKTPRIGISCRDITSDMMEPSEDYLPASIWVCEIEKDSPAEKAGLKVNDLILEADGNRITTATELQQAIKGHKIGDMIELTVYRMEGNWTTISESDPLPEGQKITFSVEIDVID